MTYSVLVEDNGERSFQAVALGLPDCRAVAATREQALAKLRKILSKRLAQAEIVEVEIPESTSAEHPWKRFAGMFENEPLFDDVLEDIVAQRQADLEDTSE